MPLVAGLDVIVLGVMLVSGFLAMVRGFLREVLSIASWIAAAVTTVLTFNKLLPPVQAYLGGSEIVAKVVVILGVFLSTLIVVTIITSKISDLVLDSRIGALDRTLGFLFGLARGLLILAVAFWFFAKLVPDKQQPDWVRDARSKTVLEVTGTKIEGAIPEEVLEKIFKRFKPDEHTDQLQPPNAAVASDTGGYSKSQRDGLRQLIEGKLMTTGR